MPDLPSHVTALVADASGEETRLEVRELPATDLGDGDVLIAVNWSGVNYKDGLASRKDGKVARISPLVPGVDLAGTVVDAGASSFAVGQSVLVHGYDMGVAHHGGYSQYARVPGEWVVPLPSALTERQAMGLGTARALGVGRGWLAPLPGRERCHRPSGGLGRLTPAAEGEVGRRCRLRRR